MKSAEVLLVQSVGAFYFGAGTPQLICRFEAVPPFRDLKQQDRRISCIACNGTMLKKAPDISGAWHEYSPALTLDASQKFLDYIAALTLPDSGSFEGEVDTSAILQHVFLRVRRETQVHSYEINMQVTGFYGPGSETIKALCRRMFALAGYSGYEHVIYGTGG